MIPRKSSSYLDVTLFWSRGGHNEEAIGWLELALTDPTLRNVEFATIQQRKLRARALSGQELFLQQEYPGALSTLQESSVLLRELGEKAEPCHGTCLSGIPG